MTVQVFRNRYCLLKAMQFDGTPLSGSALAKAFPGHVAGDLERPGGILAMAATSFGAVQLRVLKAGDWLVRDDSFSGTPVMVLSDDHFRVLYSPHARPADDIR